MGVLHREHGLPIITVKALQYFVRIFDVLLRLLAHVENRAVFTSAKNVLRNVGQKYRLIDEGELFIPGGGIPDIFDIASIAVKSELGARMSW